VILNFTPVPRTNYRIGVPASGIYHELFNSDSIYYGGSNMGNAGSIASTNEPWMGFSDSMVITLPPLAGIVFSLIDR
jgi:1,4-alpha-glucan branching enzyme